MPHTPLLPPLGHRTSFQRPRCKPPPSVPYLALAELGSPRVAIKVGAPNAEEAHLWGDFHFAHGLARALRRQGFHVAVHLLPEWDDPARQDADVTIHLRGLSTYTAKEAQVNVLWIISHPDDVSARECGKYGLVFSASERVVESLAAEGIDALFLPQATDAERFGRAEPDPESAIDVLFVGNSRGQRRPVIEWALEQQLPLTVYGAGWEGILPPGVLAGTYAPNEDLGRLYASARVVRNDHWPDMRSQALVSNRVFDVLASGGVVVSDSVPGMEGLLEGAVPICTSAQELGMVVERLRSDEGERRTLVDAGRRLVLERHTFDQRAQVMAALIWQRLEGRPRDCDGCVFGHIESVPVP
jgi:glycosyltransferase involved in cell wall biosynthesis